MSIPYFTNNFPEGINIIKSFGKEMRQLKILMVPSDYFGDETLQNRLWNSLPEGHCLDSIKFCVRRLSLLSEIITAARLNQVKHCECLLVGNSIFLNDLDLDNTLFEITTDSDCQSTLTDVETKRTIVIKTKIKLDDVYETKFW